MSFTSHGSPTVISTPGGTEIGVLPSFDPRDPVVEKLLPPLPLLPGYRFVPSPVALG
jgi:hypothetical protein